VNEVMNAAVMPSRTRLLTYFVDRTGTVHTFFGCQKFGCALQFPVCHSVCHTAVCVSVTLRISTYPQLRIIVKIPVWCQCLRCNGLCGSAAVKFKRKHQNIYFSNSNLFIYSLGVAFVLTACDRTSYLLFIHTVLWEDRIVTNSEYLYCLS
jgi:hypothetical protein